MESDPQKTSPTSRREAPTKRKASFGPLDRGSASILRQGVVPLTSFIESGCRGRENPGL